MSFIPDFIDTEAINMTIAVLSGKGGTGKTLVSVNLAAVAKKSTYIDCDVEEPNGHLFFKPKQIQEEQILVKIPKVNNELCNGCRKCVDFCKFNALAYIKNKLIVFEDLCHSCGGCILVCPVRALKEKKKSIGKIQKGTKGEVMILTGILNTGEISGVPIIENLLVENNLHANKFTFIDCPPGSACVVMESIKDADYCILVAEPTLFGVHNLNMVYELVNLFNKPFGVVINKCLKKDNLVGKFCFKKNIKILAQIPFDTNLGILNSNGEIVVNKDKKYHDMFSSLLQTVAKEVQCHETTSNP